MTITTESREQDWSLPDPLNTAQEAMRLPEVQAMLRRLAHFQLGIFMPHMHDDDTGDFRPLPCGFVQVESGCEVSFQPTDALAHSSKSFLPVGWFWRADAPTPLTVCEMVSGEAQDEAARPVKHKMKEKNR